jgi:hypothetical protein
MAAMASSSGVIIIMAMAAASAGNGVSWQRKMAASISRNNGISENRNENENVIIKRRKWRRKLMAQKSIMASAKLWQWRHQPAKNISNNGGNRIRWRSVA